MFLKQNADSRKIRVLFLLLCVGLISIACPLSLYGEDTLNPTELEMETAEGLEDIDLNLLFADQDVGAKRCHKPKLTYYLHIEDFAQSFIEIPTSNVTNPSSTVSSRYLAGRAPLYNQCNKKVGTCSASFLCMQNADGIYTDISNYLSVDNGLIVSWFTPTKLINLELDSIINSMVTECLVVASTKIGVNPFYGKTFNLVVSSENGKIYFKFTKE